MQNNDQMLHFILADFGKIGRSWAERDAADMDRKTTVADIASGNWWRVIQVIECNPAEGTCRDVTANVAWEVSALWADNGEPLETWQVNFLEEQIGMDAANSFPRRAA